MQSLVFSFKQSPRVRHVRLTSRIVRSPNCWLWGIVVVQAGAPCRHVSTRKHPWNILRSETAQTATRTKRYLRLVLLLPLRMHGATTATAAAATWRPARGSHRGCFDSRSLAPRWHGCHSVLVCLSQNAQVQTVCRLSVVSVSRCSHRQHPCSNTARGDRMYDTLRAMCLFGRFECRVANALTQREVYMCMYRPGGDGGKEAQV